MKNISERDQEVVWHPFTQVKNSTPPIPIVRGKGASLFDDEGNEYIDAVASWWVNVHGHAHPHIQQKVAEQLATLEHVIFAGFTHPWAVELSERIVAMHPAKHKKVFFSDNGSTANEVAIKMALQFWWNQENAKTKIIAFDNAYHGDTVGAMSIGGRGVFTTPFDKIMFDVAHIPVPDGKNNEVIIQQFENLVKNYEVAAFIYEPMVQGAGGMVMYDVEGMNALLKLAKQYDVILIADEVMTGFGRTGKMFASEYYDTMPDIMAMSKALTGGTMPLSLTTTKPFIFNQFLSDDKVKTFLHGHSYTGNPTACAAALASLDLMEKPEYRQNMERINQHHKRFIETLKTFKGIKNIRLTGTILAFDFVNNDQDNYFNNIRDVLYNSFIAQYIILRPLGNTVYILPPMVITDLQLENVYDAIVTTIHELKANS